MEFVQERFTSRIETNTECVGMLNNVRLFWVSVIRRGELCCDSIRQDQLRLISRSVQAASFCCKNPGTSVLLLVIDKDSAPFPLDLIAVSNVDHVTRYINAERPRVYGRIKLRQGSFQPSLSNQTGGLWGDLEVDITGQRTRDQSQQQ